MKKIINLADIINFGQDPNKLAIVDAGNDNLKYCSYQQLREYANGVSRGLLKQGIRPGDKIAIVADNSIAFISCFFGIVTIGAIAVLIDNKLNQTQISKALVESQSKFIFTDIEINSNTNLLDIKSEFINFLDMGVIDNYIPNDQDIAFILYTSGSYNQPKGALLSHKNHRWAIERHIEYDKKWSTTRISLISAPLYHANGLTTMEGSLGGGGTIVILPKFNAKDSITAIEQFKITTVYCVPTMLAMMIQEKDLLKTHSMNSVKVIRSASSNVGQKLLDNIKHFFPNALFFNSYGITEVGPGLFGPHPMGITRPPMSVGYPAEGIDYKILDGILHIKSPSMMLSYNNQTATPLSKDGYYVTNDLFEIDSNGFYYFIGRADDTFKCGGKSIYPNEVSSILEEHPAVASAYTIGIPDDIKGHKPYAFVVLENNQSTSEDEIIEFALSRMPAYQHPRRIWFLESFPFVGPNKIAKKELEKIAIENLTNQK